MTCVKRKITSVRRPKESFSHHVVSRLNTAVHLSISRTHLYYKITTTNLTSKSCNSVSLHERALWRSATVRAVRPYPRFCFSRFQLLASLAARKQRILLTHQKISSSPTLHSPHFISLCRHFIISGCHTKKAGYSTIKL